MRFSDVKPAIALFVFTAASALIVGFMFVLTEEPIAEQAWLREARAIASLIPDAGDDREPRVVELPEGRDAEVVYRALAVYGEEGDVLGYLFFAASPGYSGAVRVLVGFDPGGAIIGVRVISHTETPGLGSLIAGAPFIGQFDGLLAPVTRAISPEPPHEILPIAGATISVDAVLRAVNEAWDIFRQVEGR